MKRSQTWSGMNQYSNSRQHRRQAANQSYNNQYYDYSKSVSYEQPRESPGGRYRSQAQVALEASRRQAIIARDLQNQGLLQSTTTGVPWFGPAVVTASQPPRTLSPNPSAGLLFSPQPVHVISPVASAVPVVHTQSMVGSPLLQTNMTYTYNNPSPQIRVSHLHTPQQHGHFIPNQASPFDSHVGVDQAYCENIKREIIRHLHMIVTNKANMAMDSSPARRSSKKKTRQAPSHGKVNSSNEEVASPNLQEKNRKRRSTGGGDNVVEEKKRKSSVKEDNMSEGVTDSASSPPPSELPQDTISSPTGYTRNTEYILKYYDENHQTAEVYSRKLELREALYSTMRGIFPYAGLYIVGSSMNGFGMKNSDMDLCLMLSQDNINQKHEATEILRVIMQGFRKLSFIKQQNLIPAKVPILRFYDESTSVECDLNINNDVGIRNTHLIANYSKLDWRVKPLVLFIKQWARYHNINNAKNGTISSYSLGLMVIHYLQVACDPPVLPSLQLMYPTIFSSKRDIKELSLIDNVPAYSSLNEQTLAQLYEGFLNYFAYDFKFDKIAISVRLARSLPIQEVIKNYHDPYVWKYICIEEPFDLSNTARSVYDQHCFSRIRHVFRASASRLRKTRNIGALVSQPL